MTITGVLHVVRWLPPALALACAGFGCSGDSGSLGTYEWDRAAAEEALDASLRIELAEAAAGRGPGHAEAVKEIHAQMLELLNATDMTLVLAEDQAANFIVSAAGMEVDTACTWSQTGNVIMLKLYWDGDEQPATRTLIVDGDTVRFQPQEADEWPYIFRK